MSKENEKKEISEKEIIELFGARLLPDEIIKLILEPEQLKIIEAHQNYMFPRGNIDEKTRLTDGEMLAGAYIKCAKLWFPSSIGWLENYFIEFEHLAVSREGLGRQEGIELLTMRKAVKELASQIRGEIPKEGKKGKGQVEEVNE